MDSESESYHHHTLWEISDYPNLQTDSDFLDSSRLQIRAKICANVIVIQPFVTLSAVGDTLLWLSLADQARLRRKSIAIGKQPSMEIHPLPPPQPFRQSVSTPADPSRIPVSLPLLLPLPPRSRSHLYLRLPPPASPLHSPQKRVSTPPLPRSLPLSRASLWLSLPLSRSLIGLLVSEGWGSNPGTGPSGGCSGSLEVGYLTASSACAVGSSGWRAGVRQTVSHAEANMFICSLANDWVIMSEFIDWTANFFAINQWRPFCLFNNVKTF